MPNIPSDVLTEIANKRTPSSEEQPKDDEAKKDDAENAQPKDESKKADNPEPKKGEATKPKTNGQSIAQVAEAANEDDDDEGDDEDDHDGDQKPNRKRSSLFREFLDVKKELKETKRINKQTSQQYNELAEAMQELIGVVKDLKGNKTAQRDEIEDFAEEWGLDKEGTKALVNILEKRLSTRQKPTKGDDEDDDDEPVKKKVSKPEPKAELKARQIELAIESEYEDYLDSYPQLKDKLNLKAIKRYIIGDEENLSKSFHDIVTEMYPGVLTGKAGVDGGADGGNNRDDGEKPNWNDQKTLDRLDKDPELKKKYHEDLVGRVKASIR